MAKDEDPEQAVDSEEARLSLAACEGDRVAFGRLYERWIEGLKAFVAGEVRASKQEVEDIAEEALLTALRKARGVAEPAKLKGFAFGVAKKLAANSGRKAGRHGQEAVDQEGEPVSPEEFAGESADPEVSANDREFDERYGAAMRTLPTVEAEVFQLRARYGRNEGEIAHLFGWTEAEARRTLQRARDKVRLRMREEDLG